MIVELLPMVIGQRSEYTNPFLAFLNETKKPEVGREGGREGGRGSGSGEDLLYSVRVLRGRDTEGRRMLIAMQALSFFAHLLTFSPSLPPSLPPSVCRR